MAKLFYLHWHATEALAQVRVLREAGHIVAHHSTPGSPPRVTTPPDAFVISLARLPSHGRAVAEWCRSSATRRSIRLVFVGGEEERVRPLRRNFPEAVFCAPEELLDTLQHMFKPPGRKKRKPAAPPNTAH